MDSEVSSKLSDAAGERAQGATGRLLDVETSNLNSSTRGHGMISEMPSALMSTAGFTARGDLRGLFQPEGL